MKIFKPPKFPQNFSGWQKEQDSESLVQFYINGQPQKREMTIIGESETSIFKFPNKENRNRNIPEIKNTNIQSLQNDKQYLKKCLTTNSKYRHSLQGELSHFHHFKKRDDILVNALTEQSSPTFKPYRNNQTPFVNFLEEQNKNVLFSGQKAQNKIKRRFLIRSKLQEEITKQYLKRKQEIKTQETQKDKAIRFKLKTKTTLDSIPIARKHLTFPLFYREIDKHQKTPELYIHKRHNKNKTSINMKHTTPSVNSQEFIDDRIFAFN